MFNPSKDNRERTPKEQAAGFVASIGALKRHGAEGAKIAQDLSDLLLKVTALSNPAAVARDCSRALAEWSDVQKAKPDHAQQLAKLASRSARGLPMERSDFEKAGLIEAKPPANAAAPQRRTAPVRRMTP